MGLTLSNAFFTTCTLAVRTAPSFCTYAVIAGEVLLLYGLGLFWRSVDMCAVTLPLRTMLRTDLRIAVSEKDL